MSKNKQMDVDRKNIIDQQVNFYVIQHIFFAKSIFFLIFAKKV